MKIWSLYEKYNEELWPMSYKQCEWLMNESKRLERTKLIVEKYIEEVRNSDWDIAILVDGFGNEICWAVENDQSPINHSIMNLWELHGKKL